MYISKNQYVSVQKCESDSDHKSSGIQEVQVHREVSSGAKGWKRKTPVSWLSITEQVMCIRQNPCLRYSAYAFNLSLFLPLVKGPAGLPCPHIPVRLFHSPDSWDTLQSLSSAAAFYSSKTHEMTFLCCFGSLKPCPMSKAQPAPTE